MFETYFNRDSRRPHFAANPVGRPDRINFPNAVVVLRELNLAAADMTAEDWKLIESYQRAALQGVEKYIDSKIIPQTWDVHYDRFPRGREPLYLEIGNVQTVDYISYLDPSRDELMLSAADYKVDLSSLTPRIQPVNAWPTTVFEIGAVTVRVLAGFPQITDTGTEPQKLSEMLSDIQQAILLMIRDWWTRRGLSTDGGNLGLQSESIGDYSYTRANGNTNDPNNVGIPQAAQWLLNPYRRIAT